MSLYEKYGHIRTATMVQSFKVTNKEDYEELCIKVSNALEKVSKYFFSKDPEEEIKVRIWEAMSTACLLYEIENNLLPL